MRYWLLIFVLGLATVAAAQISVPGWPTTGGGGGTGTVTNTGGSLPTNAVVLGNTAPDIKADTALSTDGAGSMTDTQGTITTSKPLMSHTVTWNAAGVAFTNWLDNITCTAAATASIAAGFGTSGTQWQFKYGSANCGSPQMLSPDGSSSNPSYSFGSATNAGLFNNGGSPQLNTTNNFNVSVSGTAKWQFNGSTLVFLGVAGTAVQFPLYQTTTNCQLGGATGTASPAACGAAPTGSVAIPASQTSYVVNTTAVTANSHIFVQQITDNSGIATATCNSGATTPIQSTRTAATSFTITLTSVASVTCIQYWIIN